MRQSLILSAALVALIATPALAADPAKVAEAVANSEVRQAGNMELDGARHPVEFLEFAGLEEGMHVLDLVGGNGYWSEIMAPAVGPYGQVISWHPTQFYGPRVKERWASYGPQQGNVVLLVSRFEKPLLGAADSYDFVMLNQDYHDVYWVSEQYKIERMEPQEWLARLYRVVKPGGIVALADHRAADGADPRESVEAMHRIAADVTRADFEKAGFMFEAESDLLANPDDDRTINVFNPEIRGKTDRFLMKFRKPE